MSFFRFSRAQIATKDKNPIVVIQDRKIVLIDDTNDNNLTGDCWHRLVTPGLQYTTNRIKVAIIGSDSCGKTAFVRRLALNKFSNNDWQCEAPFRQVFADKSRNKVIELLDISTNLLKDLTEQARQQGTTEYKDRKFTEFTDLCGVFILYDITDRNSFDASQKLLSQISPLIAPTCEIIFIGCKMDRKSERQVTFRMAEEMITRDLGYSIIETSAKTSENCTVAIKELLNRNYEREEIISDDDYDSDTPHEQMNETNDLVVRVPTHDSFLLLFAKLLSVLTQWFCDRIKSVFAIIADSTIPTEHPKRSFSPASISTLI